MSTMPMNRSGYGQPVNESGILMQDISRQRRLAEELRQQGAEPLQGQMVSGHYVAPSWTQGLAKVLQSGLSGYQNRKLDQEERDFSSKKNKRFAEILAGNKENKVELEPTVTQTMPAYTPEQQDQFGSPLPGVQRTPQEQITQNFRQETPEEVYARQQANLMQYMNEFGNTPEAQVMLAQLNKQDDRAYTKAEKLDDRAYQGTVRAEDRDFQVANREDQQEFQRIQQKEQFGQQLTMQEKQFANQFKLQAQNQGFQAGQQSRNQAFTAGENQKTRDQQLELAGLKTGGVNPAMAKVNDAKDVISILNQAAPLINKSTSSGIGNLVDLGAKQFGVSTTGAQSAAQLRALEGTLISKMPKMSGPQSDKDVLLYRQMAGQIGDPTVPAADKKAAMDTINELNSRYAGVEVAPLPYGDKQMTPSSALGGLPPMQGNVREVNW